MNRTFLGISGAACVILGICWMSVGIAPATDNTRNVTEDYDRNGLWNDTDSVVLTCRLQTQVVSKPAPTLVIASPHEKRLMPLTDASSRLIVVSSKVSASIRDFLLREGVCVRVGTPPGFVCGDSVELVIAFNKKEYYADLGLHKCARDIIEGIVRQLSPNDQSMCDDLLGVVELRIQNRGDSAE